MRRSTTVRLALLAAIWGSSFLWIKLSLRGLSPVEVTFARLALGAAVLFVIVAVRRYQVPRSPRVWAHIAVAAVFAPIWLGVPTEVVNAASFADVASVGVACAFTGVPIPV